MDKRYQVFVSSTFTDLQNERSNVIQTLMEMDCIPAGMELFPALDEEQFKFIKTVIDDCDYYLLILGGRYGSISDTGISYTEMEYDYAVSKGMKVIALVHENPNHLVGEKIELDKEKRDKLEAFREKVKTNRLVKFWSNADQLAGLVSLSLSKTIKTYPAVGWVRADNVQDNSDLLRQLNDLRIENESLKKQTSKRYEIKNLADLDDTFLIKGSYIEGMESYKWEVYTTWKEIFKILSSTLTNQPSDLDCSEKLSYYFFNTKYARSGGIYPSIDTECFSSIKIQFIALGIINTRDEYINEQKKEGDWILTEFGKQAMVSELSIKQYSGLDEE